MRLLLFLRLVSYLVKVWLRIFPYVFLNRFRKVEAPPTEVKEEDLGIQWISIILNNSCSRLYCACVLC
jgi:hypothetical protein